MKLSGKSFVSLVIILLMIVMAIYSFDYNPRARLFPLVIGSFVLIMALLQLWSELSPKIRKKLPFLTKEGAFGAGTGGKQTADSSETNTTSEPQEQAEPWSKTFIIFLWLIGFIVLLYAIPYLFAIPIFLFFFIWLSGREKITHALTVAIGMGAFMYILFDLILNMRI